MKGKQAVATIIGALALAGCGHATRPKPLPGQEKEVSQALQGCAYGIERILPGDYYFCEAGSNYWAGRFSMARDALESASHWASKPAQHALGIMYFNGDHAVVNRPLGVAWLALAAERHEPDYEQEFVSAYKSLTPEERKQADAYWNDMKPKYGDAYAAARAKRRFDREVRDIELATAFGGAIYVNGVNNGMENGVTLVQRLKGQGVNYFAGYETHVWVGDAQLVPLGQVAQPTQAAPLPAPAKPTPGTND
jgi:TPR repeat protein